MPLPLTSRPTFTIFKSGEIAACTMVIATTVIAMTVTTATTGFAARAAHEFSHTGFHKRFVFGVQTRSPCRKKRYKHET